MRSSKRLIAAVLVLAALQPLGARENSTELYKKGARLALDGEIDRAIIVFKDVVAQSPSYCLGHYGLGKAYLYKYGMLDQAIKHLREAVKLDRRFVRGHFYLGMAYFLARKYPQAAASFKRTYSQDDTYIEALYNLATVYDIMDRDYFARRYYQKYLDEKSKEEEDLVF